MKDLLTRHYHWIILGIATLTLLGSAALLVPQLLGLGDSLTAYALATTAIKAPAPPPSVSAVAALEILKKPVAWQSREDGASPLISRPYLLKDGKLIDPMEGNEPLYPPIPNKWLIDHQLDYTDIHILDADPKHKGFTVKEEYEAGTDPNNPDQFPPLQTKLTYSDGDIRKSSFTFDFLDSEDDNGKTLYELRPRQPIPNPEKGNRLEMSTRNVAKGDTVPGAPFLKVIGYQEKKKVINDTEYDVSELTLENTLTGERHILVKKYGSREYKPSAIELIESVSFHYQLVGAPEEVITVQRGKEFNLHSLDGKYVETYKLEDFSSDGILIGKEGKSFTIKPSSPASTPAPATQPPAQLPPH